MLLIAICLTIINTVVSFPYDPVHHDDFDIDHAVAMADIDYHLASLPYENHEGYYDKGSGYGDSHYNQGGRKGDKGYDSYQGYNRGNTRNYGAEGHKGHYNDNGGRKSGHSDSSNYYKKNHSVVKDAHGNNYAVSDSFNKGSKTNGFHNIYHKEEYQKNKKFYDEANKHGYYRRYGDFGAALLAAAGKNAQGSYYDKGYKDGSYGRSGYSDKGSLYDDLKKYSGANGYDGYYGNYADYGRSGYQGHGGGYRY